MTDTYTAAHMDVVGIQFALPDTATAMRASLQSALAFCADKMRLESPEAALQIVKQGDRTAQSYFEYGLARQLAEHLGALDPHLRAVYLFDDEATPEDMVFGTARPLPIHLIAWVERKSGALDSLLAAMDRALLEGYVSLFDSPEVAHLLDAQVVDDAEVGSRSGYGALLASLHHRPLPLWQR